MARSLGVPTLTAVPQPPARRLLSVVVALALTGALSAGCRDAGSDGPTSGSTVTLPFAASAAPGDALLQAGLDQLKAGDDEAAEVTFHNVLTLDPNNVYAHYNLGLIAQNRNETQQAIKSYDAALAIDDTYAPALYNRAILTEPTDLDAAIELYRKAVDADPKFAAAFMRLGFALVHLGKNDVGSTYLQKGVALDPSMVDVEAPTYG
jgi:Tfp pilus assembly protein PilF